VQVAADHGLRFFRVPSDDCVQSFVAHADISIAPEEIPCRCRTQELRHRALLSLFFERWQSVQFQVVPTLLVVCGSAG
jgi:hypothetical protein